MPEFHNIQGWINTAPLHRKDLGDNVVLVHFWSVSCLNCLNQLGYIKRMESNLMDVEQFKIISVHSPQFGFESDDKLVKKRAAALDINYPIALDSEKTLWRSYGARENPALFLIDARGRVRAAFNADAPPETIEKKLIDLLHESGRALDRQFPMVNWKGIERRTVKHRISFGYRALSPLGNETGIKAGIAKRFTVPEVLREAFFYLSGTWKIEAEFLLPSAESSSILIPTVPGHEIFFLAGIKSARSTQAQVMINGRNLTRKTAGRDIRFKGEKSYLMAHDHRPYHILSAGQEKGFLEIIFENPDVEVYSAEYR